MKTKSDIRYSLLLVLAAVIWGLAFVAQSAGMDYVGPFTFNGIRNFIGTLVLIPVALFRDKKNGVSTKWNDKRLIIGGAVCGTFLFFASSTQQIGIISTTAGKSGFITALYIVLVPIFSIALKKKPGKYIWLSVLLALAGLYFLCINGAVTVQSGDLWLFACAILFAGQILAVDKFAPDLDTVKLAAYQFFTVGLISIIPIIFEKPTMGSLIDCAIPILYAGVLSSGVAYTLQMVGQKRVEPTLASLIMSLESVFSVLFGFVVLHERLSGRELIGCLIMFGAVIFAQLAPSDRKKEK